MARIPKEAKERQKNKVKELHSKGFTNRQIMVHVGGTESKISKIIKQLGLAPNRALSDTDIARLKDMHADGATDGDIAAELVKAISTVRLAREKMGLFPNIKKARGWNPDFENAIVYRKAEDREMYGGRAYADPASQVYLGRGVSDEYLARMSCYRPDSTGKRRVWVGAETERPADCPKSIRWDASMRA